MENINPQLALPNGQTAWEFKLGAAQGHTAKIITYSKYGLIDDIKRQLSKNPEILQQFEDSPFGHFLQFDTEQVFCGGVMHHIFAREIKFDGKRDDEFWYRIGSNFLRFSKEEFCLVTGLKFGLSDWDTREHMHPPSDGVYRTFEGKSVCAADLWDWFSDGSYAAVPEDELKIAYVLLAELILFGIDPSNSIRRWLWSLVEDTQAFNSFPWGKWIFKNLSNYMTRVVADDTIMKNQYHVWGFILAFQIWAFECIPKLADLCGRRIHEEYPRYIRWKRKKSHSAKEVAAVLESNDVLAIRMVPTEGETEKRYWQDINIDLDEGEPVVPKKRRRIPGEPKLPKSTQGLKDNAAKEGATGAKTGRKGLAKGSSRGAAPSSLAYHPRRVPPSSTSPPPSYPPSSEDARSTDLLAPSDNGYLHMSQKEDLINYFQNFMQKIDDQHQRSLEDAYQALAKLSAQQDEYFTKMEKKLTDSITSQTAELVELMKTNYVSMPSVRDIMNQFMVKFPNLCHKDSESAARKDQVTANCHLEQPLCVVSSIQYHPHRSDMPNPSDQDLNDPGHAVQQEANTTTEHPHLSDVLNPSDRILAYNQLTELRDGVHSVIQAGYAAETSCQTETEMMLNQSHAVQQENRVLANNQLTKLHGDVHSVIQAGYAAETSCQTETDMMLDPSHAMHQEARTATGHPHLSELPNPSDRDMVNNPLPKVCEYEHALLDNTENDVAVTSSKIGPEILKLVLTHPSDQLTEVDEDVPSCALSGNAAETPRQTGTATMLNQSLAVQHEATTAIKHPHESEVSNPSDRDSVNDRPNIVQKDEYSVNLAGYSAEASDQIGSETMPHPSDGHAGRRNGIK